MLKAHHCKSFKGDIAFLDKWLVNKIDTLLTTIPMYVYICCYVHIHIYAAILKNKTYKFFECILDFAKNPFGLWASRIGSAFQKPKPIFVSSLTLSVCFYAHYEQRLFSSN